MISTRKHVLMALIFGMLCFGGATDARAATIPISFNFSGTTHVSGFPDVSFTDALNGTVTPFGTAAFTDTGVLHINMFDPSGTSHGEGTFNFSLGGANSFGGTLLLTAFAIDPMSGSNPFTFNFTITGGSGIFAGGNGSAVAQGRSGPYMTNPAPINFSGSGMVSAPRLSAIPEPGTMLLLGMSLAGLGVAVRRRRSRLRKLLPLLGSELPTAAG